MTEEINDAKISELKEAFDMFDRDKDGLINYLELGNILRSQGYYPNNEQELKEMIKLVDEDDDDLIKFEDFVQLMQSKLKKTDIANELLEAFNYFDKNGQGTISCNEFRHIMSTLGEKITDEEINYMMKYADPYNTGNIEYKNFVEILTA